MPLCLRPCGWRWCLPSPSSRRRFGQVAARMITATLVRRDFRFGLIRQCSRTGPCPRSRRRRCRRDGIPPQLDPYFQARPWTVPEPRPAGGVFGSLLGNPVVRSRPDLDRGQPWSGLPPLTVTDPVVARVRHDAAGVIPACTLWRCRRQCHGEEQESGRRHSR